METERRAHHVINPNTRIGHVHLKVANIERALWFYRDILGFEITQWYGDEAVFLSAGGYHHHIGVNVWNGRGAGPPPPHTAGLRHWTVRLPGAAQVDAVRTRVEAAGLGVAAVDGGFAVPDPWGTALHVLATAS
jgi:catechol 2,3-dioxygenase